MGCLCWPLNAPIVSQCSVYIAIDGCIQFPHAPSSELSGIYCVKGTNVTNLLASVGAGRHSDLDANAALHGE